MLISAESSACEGGQAPPLLSSHRVLGLCCLTMGGGGGGDECKPTLTVILALQPCVIRWCYLCAVLREGFVLYLLGPGWISGLELFWDPPLVHPKPNQGSLELQCIVKASTGTDWSLLAVTHPYSTTALQEEVVL